MLPSLMYEYAARTNICACLFYGPSAVVKVGWKVGLTQTAGEGIPACQGTAYRLSAGLAQVLLSHPGMHAACRCTRRRAGWGGERREGADDSLRLVFSVYPALKAWGQVK